MWLAGCLMELEVQSAAVGPCLRAVLFHFREAGLGAAALDESS